MRHRKVSLTGFTLVELLISAAIITIVSSIVLVRFNAFDSTTLLKSIAYEVATTVREAQIYAVSVVNTESGASASFRYPYGLSFSRNSSTYTFFRYESSDTSKTPAFGDDNDGVSELALRVIALGGSTQVADVCVTTATGDKCASTGGISQLDISFRRPEFSAIIRAPGVNTADISAAKIYLHSTRNTANQWVIEVKLLGQITVYPKP